MSVDRIVRSIVVNVGDIGYNDDRIRFLYTDPDTDEAVYGLEFPIHKPNRSLHIAGREHVGRPHDTPAFWPTPPLTTGQDAQTTDGCAVSATADLAPDGQGNFVQLALVAYDPPAGTVGRRVAYLDVNAANAISAARFNDMNVVAKNKYVARQSNITLVVLAGLTNQVGVTPGTYGQPGLTITGLTAQLEYEIFA